ncbi:DUF6290 family protein [Streptococcus sanguinis]|uniref:DUF6290 family protein n=1 Tax=Streptococcus sanguinis TaxID=1305 RepID=UPI0022AA1469|nr:DUF6290 family protein [Streptococcus sanguinis]
MWTSSHNISKSEFIAQVLAEKLEDLYDIQETDFAMQEWLDNGQETYSHDEVLWLDIRFAMPQLFSRLWINWIEGHRRLLLNGLINIW